MQGIAGQPPRPQGAAGVQTGDQEGDVLRRLLQGAGVRGRVLYELLLEADAEVGAEAGETAVTRVAVHVRPQTVASGSVCHASP